MDSRTNILLYELKGIHEALESFIQVRGDRLRESDKSFLHSCLKEMKEFIEKIVRSLKGILYRTCSPM